MACWTRRLEEIIAECDGRESPSKIRIQELEHLIREQCREIVAEEIQKYTAQLLHQKIFVEDAENVHNEPCTGTTLSDPMVLITPEFITSTQYFDIYYETVDTNG